MPANSLSLGMSKDFIPAKDDHTGDTIGKLAFAGGCVGLVMGWVGVGKSVKLIPKSAVYSEAFIALEQLFGNAIKGAFVGGAGGATVALAGDIRGEKDPINWALGGLGSGFSYGMVSNNFARGIKFGFAGGMFAAGAAYRSIYHDPSIEHRKPWATK